MKKKLRTREEDDLKEIYSIVKILKKVFPVRNCEKLVFYASLVHFMLEMAEKNNPDKEGFNADILLITDLQKTISINIQNYYDEIINCELKENK